MRRIGVLMICCVLNLWCEIAAQHSESISSVERLVGTWSLEEVAPEDIERLEGLLSRPLTLNDAGFNELTSSGLFTPFQIASVIDYRNRHGDILSFQELSCIDGFSYDVVEVLKPFLDLYAAELPGIRKSSSRNVMNELYLRNAFRTDSALSTDWNYGAKYRLEADQFSFSISFSNSYDDSEVYPTLFSANMVYKYGRGKLVVGDFNARYGQGMCLWNTMVISGLNSPDAYMRKPSGITPTFSFTGNSALTGVCAEHRFGRWNMTALLAFPGVKDIHKRGEKIDFLPALNISHYGRNGQIGLTHLMSSDCMNTSFDLEFCFRGVNLFGELLLSWLQMDTAFVGGVDFMAEESLRLAALVRCLQVSDTYGLAVSGEYVRKKLSGVFSADYEYYPEGKARGSVNSMQLKLQTSWVYDISDKLSLKLRVSERWRTWGKPFKTHLRADLSYEGQPFYAGLRVDFQLYDKYALLGYLESGFKGIRFAVFLRQGIFRVDDWDDRIYVYERDAPGSFSVPAYYGRGVWMAVTTSFKASRFLKLYLRGSYLSYPFMHDEKKKPGRAELKIQCVFRF